jgi:hypothetical protein
MVPAIANAELSPTPPALRHPPVAWLYSTPPFHIPAMASTIINGMANGGSSASDEPIEVAFPLPRAPQSNIHLQLRNNGPNIVLFLTSSTPEASSSVPLGSFVYAMPNVRLAFPAIQDSLLTSKSSELHPPTRSVHPSSRRATPWTLRHDWRNYWRRSWTSRFTWETL